MTLRRPDKSENNEDDSLAMIAKGFKKMFRKHLEFKRIWKGSSSRRNKRNPKHKFSSKDDTNQNTCYSFGLLGYIIKDCPNIKKKNEKTIFKFKRVEKRVMVAT